METRAGRARLFESHAGYSRARRPPATYFYISFFFLFFISHRLFLFRRTSLAFARLPGCFRAGLCKKKFGRELVRAART